MTFTGNSRTTTSRMVSWDDYLNERMRREDTAVAAKFSYYKNLGRGHLRGDLVKGWRNED